MAIIIGNSGYGGGVDPSGAALQQGLNGIASAFLDTSAGDVKRAALAKAQRDAAGDGQLGNLFGKFDQPTAQAYIANGGDIRKLSEAIRLGQTLANGPNDQTAYRAAVGSGAYSTTPQYSQDQAAIAARAADTARQNAPVNALDANGQPIFTTQGAAQKGGFRPVLGSDQVKGNLAQVFLNPKDGAAADEQETPKAAAEPQPTLPSFAGPSGFALGSVFSAPAPTLTGGAGVPDTGPGALSVGTGGFRATAEPQRAPAALDTGPGALVTAPKLNEDQRSFLGLDGKAAKVQNYQVNGPDGRPIAVGRTSDGKTDLTTGQPLPQNATIAGTGSGSGQNININNGEKAEDAEAGKARGGLLADAIKAGPAARQKIQTLTQLNEALTSGGGDVRTGPFGDTILKGKQAIQDALGIDLGGIPQSELASKLGFTLATQLAKEITNRPAQAEFLRGLENVPGLTISPEGNKALISLQIQDAQHKEELSAIALHSKSYAEYAAKEAQFYKEHPLVSPFSGKPFGAADVQFLTDAGKRVSGGAPTAAAPQGQQAPSTSGKTPGGFSFSVVQ